MMACVAAPIYYFRKLVGIFAIYENIKYGSQLLDFFGIH
jgi:hypothetical protein